MSSAEAFKLEFFGAAERFRAGWVSVSAQEPCTKHGVEPLKRAKHEVVPDWVGLQANGFTLTRAALSVGACVLGSRLAAALNTNASSGFTGFVSGAKIGAWATAWAAQGVAFLEAVRGLTGFADAQVACLARAGRTAHFVQLFGWSANATFGSVSSQHTYLLAGTVCCLGLTLSIAAGLCCFAVFVRLAVCSGLAVGKALKASAKSNTRESCLAQLNDAACGAFGLGEVRQTHGLSAGYDLKAKLARFAVGVVAKALGFVAVFEAVALNAGGARAAVERSGAFAMTAWFTFCSVAAFSWFA